MFTPYFEFRVTFVKQKLFQEQRTYYTGNSKQVQAFPVPPNSVIRLYFLYTLLEKGAVRRKEYALYDCFFIEKVAFKTEVINKHPENMWELQCWVLSDIVVGDTLIYDSTDEIFRKEGSG